MHWGAKLLMIVMVVIVGGCMQQPLEKQTEISQVCVQEKCVEVELAVSDAERQRGLMYREDLADGSGMLFVFDEQNSYSFWMKNTLIPLDIIRIDDDLHIVDSQTAEPCRTDTCKSYLPAGEASYVLEINAGQARAYNFLTGEIVEIK